MINWLVENTVFAGIITTLLMWLDWILTIAQEKERRSHYYDHYESYPVNTIEGNHIVRKDVEDLKVINPKHHLIAIGLGIFVWIFLKTVTSESGLIFIGFIWGIFLIVNT